MQETRCMFHLEYSYSTCLDLSGCFPRFRSACQRWFWAGLVDLEKSLVGVWLLSCPAADCVDIYHRVTRTNSIFYMTKTKPKQRYHFNKKTNGRLEAKLKQGRHYTTLTVVRDLEKGQEQTGFHADFCIMTERLGITHLTTVPDEGSQTAWFVRPTKANWTHQSLASWWQLVAVMHQFVGCQPPMKLLVWVALIKSHPPFSSKQCLFLEKCEF